MASKQIKRIEKPLASKADSVATLAMRAWLAGLSRLSIAQQHTTDVYARLQMQRRAISTKLIVEGSELQRRTSTLLREVSADVKAQAEGVFVPVTVRLEQTRQRCSAVIDGAVAEVLRRVGVPTKQELDDLRKRIASLSRQVKSAKTGSASR